MDPQVSLQAHTSLKTTFSTVSKQRAACVPCILLDVVKEWTDGHSTCDDLGWVAKRNPTQTQVEADSSNQLESTCKSVWQEVYALF